MKPGQILQMGPDLYMTPWNDLIWEYTWKNFLKSERLKAQWHLNAVLSKARFDLGLPQIPLE